MIKAVIFDYFGVISSDAYWELLSKDQERNATFGASSDAVNIGQISWHQFIEAAAVATKKSTKELDELFEKERINPLVVGLINQLHKKYKTAIITNASNDFLEPILQKNHLYSLFDGVFVSSSLGISKPDKRIFRYALDRLGVLPAEAVYIDDVPINVEAAQSLGINAFVFSGYQQAKTQLDDLLSK